MEDSKIISIPLFYSQLRSKIKDIILTEIIREFETYSFLYDRLEDIPGIEFFLKEQNLEKKFFTHIKKVVWENRLEEDKKGAEDGFAYYSEDGEYIDCHPKNTLEGFERGFLFSSLPTKIQEKLLEDEINWFYEQEDQFNVDFFHSFLKENNSYHTYRKFIKEYYNQAMLEDEKHGLQINLSNNTKLKILRRFKANTFFKKSNMRIS